MSSHTIQELVAMEPILGASRDELERLQLERLRSTLRHAYANNANYRRKFDAAGVSSRRSSRAGRFGALPVHDQGGPEGGLSLWFFLGTQRASRAHSRVLRHYGQAHRGWVYAERSRHLG